MSNRDLVEEKKEALIMLNNGEKVTAIAKALKVTLKTVSKWKVEFQNKKLINHSFALDHAGTTILNNLKNRLLELSKDTTSRTKDIRNLAYSIKALENL